HDSRCVSADGAETTEHTTHGSESATKPSRAISRERQTRGYRTEFRHDAETTTAPAKCAAAGSTAARATAGSTATRATAASTAARATAGSTAARATAGSTAARAAAGSEAEPAAAAK